MAERHYITRAGAQRLADELTRLLRVERPRVVQEVADAAAQGDRSENAEYIYGKKRLREIDRRARFLQKRLDELEVVELAGVHHPDVRFGATVSLVDEDGRRHEYTLVGQDESEPELGRISYRSPIGQSLLRKRVGDLVTVRRPIGDLEVEVTTIRYEAQ